MDNTTSYATSTASTVYWGEFGSLQYLEVIYLTIITVLGTIGNLIVIFSIALEKRVHAHGNIFIINLAVADFLVSALVNPTVIAHVINGADAIGEVFCDIIGYLVTSTCTCSLVNLMFIAINRYWAVVRPSTYQKTFRRKRVYYMMAFTWVFSVIVVSPTVLGWGRLGFDAKILVCLWDDTADYGYTWFITTVAVIIPMGIIGACYFKLFRTVRGSGRWVRSLSTGSGISQQTDQHRRSMRKERSLLKTLVTTVVLFSICWVPFALCVLINPGTTHPHLKKVAGWLALTNSCVNFIIYGAMNPVFRRGYRNLFIFVFRCKRAQHVSSAMLHGSFSDSFRTRRGIQGVQVRNGSFGNNLSDFNRDMSRNDSVGGMPPGVSQVTETTVQGYSPVLPRVLTNKQARREPSPLTVRALPVLYEGNKAKKVSTLPVSLSQKKALVQAFRRASSKRKSRPRANTADNQEEDKRWRARRNSAMLLQIEMGDGVSSDEEEFDKAHHDRFARRSQSEISPARHENGNSNNFNKGSEVVLGVNGIKKDFLKRSWMPDRAVYISKQSTPLNGSVRSLSTSPSKKVDVVTVSNGIAHAKSNSNEKGDKRDQEGDQLSPSQITLTETNRILDNEILDEYEIIEKAVDPTRIQTMDTDVFLSRCIDELAESIVHEVETNVSSDDNLDRTQLTER